MTHSDNCPETDGEPEGPGERKLPLTLAGPLAAYGRNRSAASPLPSKLRL